MKTRINPSYKFTEFGCFGFPWSKGRTKLEAPILPSFAAFLAHILIISCWADGLTFTIEYHVAEYSPKQQPESQKFAFQNSPRITLPFPPNSIKRDDVSTRKFSHIDAASGRFVWPCAASSRRRIRWSVSKNHKATEPANQRCSFARQRTSVGCCC